MPVFSSKYAVPYSSPGFIRLLAKFPHDLWRYIIEVAACRSDCTPQRNIEVHRGDKNKDEREWMSPYEVFNQSIVN